MINIVLIIHLLLALALIVVVLLQRSEGGALGIGGGGGGGAGGFGLMSARGTANMLTRATAIIAACFILTSLLLAILAGGDTTSKSILDHSPSGSSQKSAVPLSE